VAHDRRKQKKLAAHKKKREEAKKKERKKQLGQPTSEEGLLRRAADYPPGPAYLSAGWREESAPALVTAVATRLLPNGRYLAGVALVDRTCLGVKSGYALPVVDRAELDEFLADAEEAHGGMEEHEPALVASLVFSAIDYARSLGFQPDPAFPAGVFGPRPAALTPTPFAKPARPLYIAGPDDNVPAILAQLEAAVGPDGFDFTLGAEREDEEEELDDLDDEREDEDEDARG
jgi:hypothetical protein